MADGDDAASCVRGTATGSDIRGGMEPRQPSAVELPDDDHFDSLPKARATISLSPAFGA